MTPSNSTDPQGPDTGRARSFAGLDREKWALVFIPVTILILALAIVLGGVGLTGLTIAAAFLTLILFVGSRRDERETVEVAGSADSVHRILVLANEGLGGTQLADELRSHTNGGRSHVRVVVPALASALKRITSDVDDEIGRAEADAEQLVGEVNDAGLDAEGFVGDADPTQALEDALKTYPADEVIVVNPEADAMGRLERAATARAKDATPIPFTGIHVA
jgi:hypothetical protein